MLLDFVDDLIICSSIKLSRVLICKYILNLL